MPLVHVVGFPKEQAKIMVSFRNYFNASSITSDYWITKISDSRNSNLKEVTVDFQSFDDALKAEDYMNTVPYVTQHGHEYNLDARIVDQDNSGYGLRSGNDRYQDGNYRSRSRGYSNDRYSSSRYSNDRDRSRSPLQDPSKLDLEIELLRKKRLLIEEERRLLLEKKKLEMIKEFGPSACAEYDVKIKRGFGEGSSTLFQANATTELERDQRERDRLLRPRRTDGQMDQTDRARAPPPEQRALANIPKFVLPCKIILGQMKKAIKQKSQVLHERTILTKMISANLRRRFAIVLEHKRYTPSDAIVKLYRQVYPSATDAEFINKTLQDVRACHWPKREKSQKTLEKMAKRKAEKAKIKAILAGEAVPNEPGTSTNAAATEVVKDVKSESKNQENDVKPNPETNQGNDIKPDPETPTEAKVKTEAVADTVQVKPEINTSVVEENAGDDEEDWAENGVEWSDDDDSKDGAQPENLEN